MKIFNEKINREENDSQDYDELLLGNFWKIYKSGTVKDKRKAREVLKRAGIIYFYDYRYGIIIGKKKLDK